MSKKQQQQLQQEIRDICQKVLRCRHRGDFSVQEEVLVDSLRHHHHYNDDGSKNGKKGGISLLQRNMTRAIWIEFRYEHRHRSLRNRTPESRSADWRLAIVSHLWSLVSSSDDGDRLEQIMGSSGGDQHFVDHELDGVALYWRARLLFEYWGCIPAERQDPAALKHGVDWCNLCIERCESAANEATELTSLEPWIAIPTLAKVLKAQIHAAMGDETQAIDVYRALYDSMLHLGEDGASGINRFSKCDSLVMITAQRTALHYPEMLLSMGNVEECVNALRNMFNRGLVLHVEVQFMLLRLLGNVLLHDANAIRYVPLKQNGQKEQKKKKKQNKSTAATAPQDSMPVPRNATEEALLVLLVLQQLVESSFMAFNLETLSKNDVASLYDDLCVLLSSTQQYQPLLSIYERGLTQFYENPRFWHQYALALINAKEYTRALGVLQECMSLQPGDITPILSAVKVYLNNLPHSTDNLNECMQLAQLAMEKTQENPFFTHRCHHALGLAFGALSRRVGSRTEQQSYQNSALEHLKRSQEMDSHDHLVCFHLALQYAEIQDIPKAFSLVKRSIELHGQFVDAWILLALLFTCTKDYTNSIKTVRVARKEFPSNLRLMILNARLEEMVEVDKRAVNTYSKLRDYVSGIYLGGLFRNSEDEEDDVNENGDGVGVNGDGNKPSVANLAASVPSVNSLQDTDTLPRTRIAQYKILSSMHKLSKRRDKAAKAYMIIVDAFRRFSIFDEATTTVKMAQDLLTLSSDRMESNPIMPTHPLQSQKLSSAQSQAHQNRFSYQKAQMSADIHFSEGMINESTKRIDEAILEYERALLMDNDHKHALLRLGVIHFQQKKHTISRSLLQQAVRVDPTYYPAWHQLGVVLKDMGEFKEASDCLFTALQLEQSAPLLPFDLLLRRKL